ncbi:endospore germination permease [Halalkalibacterium halodurans]|uniref:Spore germination protein n=1 Tax=Halalkalibacterium halodurans (strain ATCC BAA-125 / DSM 18197 / FERM 7344 / JCM 9153 / C-125) TaxID=272558 RepID=Q9KDV6_HALH5|nr:endospore germination permease [Halalkalibacterium halodurans]MDY7221638.1 endospore germination permease [Halalkalibacterium halodurans]MDY7240914.1 endospore germination permease [Halalkalibacterium halodurans]MED4079309.1 endospore germination permease [Halalkalibacterium halodurans]MED4085380.1 endospore germination permease [Halalkalibacterium halodurans]MED4104496.1 endospore germination permease [Halalkalibacterium halodurans]
MNKQQISAFQFNAVFFSFITGSTILNAPAPMIGFAQNGAWLSVVISLAGGLLLLWGMLFLYDRFPDLNLIEYSRKLVGSWFTWILAIPFITMQLHSTAGIVVDVGLFMTTTMMRETPLYVFVLLIFLVSSLTARAGIEAFARLFPILMATVLLFSIFVMILASVDYDPSFLLPILPDGIKPVLLGTYFFFGIPVTEIILFSMLLPYVRKDERTKVKKGMVYALIINHILMILVTVSTLLVFGPIAGDRPFSMYEVARTIALYEVFEGSEILIGYSLIIASFMKDVVSLYMMNVTLVAMFKLKDKQIFIFPLALVSFLFAMVFISLGVRTWATFVTVREPLWKGVAYVVPLIVLVIAALVKGKRSVHQAEKMNTFS